MASSFYAILHEYNITLIHTTNSNLVYFREKISPPFVEILIQMRYHDKNYISNLIFQGIGKLYRAGL